MPNLSSYPSGFPGGVAIQGMPVLNTYGGNVYWVNSSGGGDGNKGTRQRPFATLDYAIGRCTANNGDVIMVMPNHAETITGAGGIALDVAGVTVVGMGIALFLRDPMLEKARAEGRLKDGTIIKVGAAAD